VPAPESWDDGTEVKYTITRKTGIMTVDEFEELKADIAHGVEALEIQGARNVKVHVYSGFSSSRLYASVEGRFL